MLRLKKRFFLFPSSCFAVDPSLRSTAPGLFGLNLLLVLANNVLHERHNAALTEVTELAKRAAPPPPPSPPRRAAPLPPPQL